MKAEFDKYLANDTETSKASFQTKLKKLREQYKKNHWNDNKLDAALAVVSTSSDSLFKNIKFDSAELWVTGAFKASKNSQLVIDVNGQHTKNLSDTLKVNAGKTYINVAVPIRYLIGTNRVKGFAEAQYSYVGQFEQHKYLINIGAEFNLIDGI